MLDEASLALVQLALAEDLRDVGDVTTLAVIEAEATGRAALIAKQDAILAGSAVFEATFTLLDARVTVEWLAKDGEAIANGDVIAHVAGPLRAIITAERTALNFIQRLSGVATQARRFVEAADASRIEIRDTRKTTPGMRVLEKAAVSAAGGTNHRMGLFDAILLKDNHVAACGGIANAVAKARKTRPDLKIQIECETLEQVREAVRAGVDEILLDNMDVATLKEAATICDCGVKTEASGGVTLTSINAIAHTGVDAVSVGAITHSAPAIDLSLELEPDASRG